MPKTKAKKYLVCKPQSRSLLASLEKSRSGHHDSLTWLKIVDEQWLKASEAIGVKDENRLG